MLANRAVFMPTSEQKSSLDDLIDLVAPALGEVATTEPLELGNPLCESTFAALVAASQGRYSA